MKLNIWRIAFFITYVLILLITIACGVMLGINSNHHAWSSHDCNITKIEIKMDSNFYDYIVSLELVSVEFHSDPFSIKIPSTTTRYCQKGQKSQKSQQITRHALVTNTYPTCPMEGDKLRCYLHFKENKVDQIKIQNPEDSSIYIVGICMFGPFAVFLFIPIALQIRFCLESFICST